jgi:hypothetical protein
MTKKAVWLAALLAAGATLYGQQDGGAERVTAGGLFLSVGENLASNTLLYLANRYIAREDWAMISAASVRANLSGPWVWDRDEYFTNQFGHPYQGSVYHAAARSNGFGFYSAVLFDAFGSLTWELVFETNAPSINDLVSTTLGGASLGEMFHRLYLETRGPSSFLAPLVSPADAVNNLITRRSPPPSGNIYGLKLASGFGFTYAEQSVEAEKGGGFRDPGTRRMASMASADAVCSVVYGDPFGQRSAVPYEHFELNAAVNLGLPFWYNLKLLSDAYLFSFPVLDGRTAKASTGLSLHYDLFADRHIDFFCQALDWAYKYRKRFAGGTGLEFKGHIGWNVFTADTFYVHGDYAGLRRTNNNYGTGTNMKLVFAVSTPWHGTFEWKAFVYGVLNVFQNENMDAGSDLCVFGSFDYSFPIGGGWAVGLAASTLWHKTDYDTLPDTAKLTHDAKLYIARRWPAN